MKRENLRLNEAIDRYLERITNEGQADRSVYTARYALTRFSKAVGKNPYVHSITAADMDVYCYGPGGIRQNIGAAYFNRTRSVLKLFFEYALLMRWTDVNPMSGIAPARPDAPKSRLMLNATELLVLLENCTNPIERIACSIGMNTGLRGNDVRHLTLFDVSVTSGVIQTEIRKTKKLDVKPITMDLRFELMHWLNEYAQMTGYQSWTEMPQHWLLVPTFRWNGPGAKIRTMRLRPEAMHTNPWRLVQRPLARMGYPTKGEGFHTLRRSSARVLFELQRSAGEGRDHALMVVKEFLNHSSTSQTEHYLGLNHERVIRDGLLKDRPFLSALAGGEQARAVGEAG